MKNPSEFLINVVKSCWVLLIGVVLIASTSFAAQPVPSDAPPKIDQQDQSETTVTHLKPARLKQTQKTTTTGMQEQVQVTNSVGTYVVKPNQSIGTSLPGDASSSSNNPAQWVVKSWGGSKNTEVTNDAPPTLQPNPHPEK